MKQSHILSIVIVTLSLVAGLTLATIARYPDATHADERPATMALGLIVGFGLVIYYVVLNSKNTDRSSHDASDN